MALRPTPGTCTLVALATVCAAILLIEPSGRAVVFDSNCRALCTPRTSSVMGGHRRATSSARCPTHMWRHLRRQSSSSTPQALGPPVAVQAHSVRLPVRRSPLFLASRQAPRRRPTAPALAAYLASLQAVRLASLLWAVQAASLGSPSLLPRHSHRQVPHRRRRQHLGNRLWASQLLASQLLAKCSRQWQRAALV